MWSFPQGVQTLLTHACWVITTPDGETIGLQTTIQFDGDVLLRVTPEALAQPVLWRTHLAQLQRTLTVLRRLRLAIAWGSTLVPLGLSLPLALGLWRQTAGHVWASSAGTLLGHWLLKRGVEALGRLYLGRLLRQVAQGPPLENRE